MTEERLRELLREQRAPDERAAEERGWRVVREAYAQRGPAVPRRRGLRLAAALAAAAVLLAAAFTPPGQAVAEWVRDAVRPGREDARKALVSLPARGRLLVTSERGPWIVERDGPKRLLGDYEEASWSPRGLFVVATRDHELFALEPGGRPRWSLARAGRVRHARWSPDGFRIAYLSGSGVRVVAGDGTGDAALVPDVALTAPAWRPDTRHRLAYADRRGRVAVVDTDTKRTLWRSGPGSVPAELAWSADGARLLVLSSEQVRVLDSRGRSLLTLRMAPGTRAQTAAFAPGGDAFALVSYAEAAERTRLELVRFAEKGAAQRLLSGLGRFGDIAWSPDGQWLLAAWRDADQWVFIHTGAKRRAPIERLRAVANITRQFDPGGGRRAAFPQLGGWCCPP
jgi:hypothetical protein